MRMHNVVNFRQISRLRAGLFVAMVIALATMLLNAAPASTQQDVPVTDPSKDPIGQVNLDDDELSILIELEFSRRTAVQATNVEVIPGRTRMNVGNPPLLRADLFDHYDKLVRSANYWHPLWQFYYNLAGDEVVFAQEQGSGQIIIPLLPELDQVSITDVALEQHILTVDLDPAIIEFCTENPSHPDCISDLSLTKTSTPDAVLVGDRIQYTLSVKNEGANPVRTFEVVDTLPKGVTYLGNSPYCTEAPVGTLTCTLDEALTVGETFDIDINVIVATDLEFSDRRPLSLANHASVTMLAGDDTDLSNNDAVVATDVHAVGDLAILSLEEVSGEAGANRQKPPSKGNEREVNTITLESAITNNGPTTPIDVAMSMSVQPLGDGITVELAGTNPSEALAVASGEVRYIADQIIVVCEQPGMHEFKVTKQVSPLDPADVDNDLSNNTMSTRIGIVCQGGGDPKK